ncbi:TPA: protein YgfX [Aeromonas hydrophila]
MPVTVSRQQRLLLLSLFLLILWPLAALIHGWQWALLLPCWALGLWRAWHSAGSAAGLLEWDGQWLTWQGHRYQLGVGSRIWPGVLWLQLVAAERPAIRLWLFSDALVPAHYRTLARAIHLSQPTR